MRALVPYTAIHVFLSWPAVWALFESGDILPRYCIITVYKFIIVIEAPECIIPGTRLSAGGCCVPVFMMQVQLPNDVYECETSAEIL